MAYPVFCINATYNIAAYLVFRIKDTYTTVSYHVFCFKDTYKTAAGLLEKERRAVPGH